METEFVRANDLQQAREHLHEYGYCLLAQVLSRETVIALRTRVVEIAEQEIHDRVAYLYSDGSNQRIWNLLNKGHQFEELVQHEVALEAMTALLGEVFLLSNIEANIVGPGGGAMQLHADQGFAPSPWAYPLVGNAIWMLNDFSAENGTTRVVARSHLARNRSEPQALAANAIPICAPAGSLLILDGRVWHQSGTNVTVDDRRIAILTYYCRPFVRPQENFFVSLRPDVLERATSVLRRMLGWQVYLSLGMIDGMPQGTACVYPGCEHRSSAECSGGPWAPLPTRV